MGKEIFRVEDVLGSIVVTQRGDKRVLSFDSLMEQSSVLMSKPYYLNHEYTQMMLLGLLFVDAGQVTIMGLGGGSLVHCLNYYYPKINMQVVELRQAVIDVAYEWFKLPRLPQIQVYHGDARQFLSRAVPASSDIIFSDLYQAGVMSELQAQQSYIESCYRVLGEHGWLVLNLHSMPEKNSALIHSIFRLFSEIYVCHGDGGNCIIFCGNSAGLFDKKTLHSRAEALVQRVQMPLMRYYKKLQPLTL